ncbi:MAG: hypothetical protein U5R06_17425 [candidate division KSB1 bacterium]|nr:hypothetical protein [candidate division KSB1 bacterium]
MNLLRDKREEEQFDVQNESFEEEPYDSSELDEEYQADVAPQKSPNIPRKKTPLLFWVTLFLLLVGFAVIYFTQFYDKSKSLSLDQFGQTSEQESARQQERQAQQTAEPQNQSPVEQPEQTEQQIQQETQQAATEQQTQTQAADQEQPTSTTDVVRSLSRVVTAFNHSMTQDISLGTFILDPYSISAEVTGSAESIRAFYSGLSANSPDYLTLNPLSSDVGNTVLLSGRLQIQNSGAGSGTNITSNAINSTLNALMSDANLTKLIMTTQTGSSGRYRVFLKTQGSFTECVDFIDRIAEHQWNPDVSKLIILPDGSSKRTFVLRLVY